MEQEISRFPLIPWVPLGIVFLFGIVVEYWIGVGWIIAIVPLWMALANLLIAALTVRIFTDGKSFTIRKNHRELVIPASEVFDVENAAIGPFMILRVRSKAESGDAYTFFPRTDYSMNDLWGADVIDTVAKICGWTKR